MTALDWVRSKATQSEQYVMTVTPEEGAATECEPGDYLVTRWRFAGRLPYRMAKEMRGEYGKLINAADEIETCRVGGQYRSEEGNCEYFRVTYKKMET